MRLALLTCAACIASGAAQAHDCIRPPAPQVVEQRALEPGARNAMAERIDAYIAEMNRYLACLERSDAEARAEAERIIEQWEGGAEEVIVVQ